MKRSLIYVGSLFLLTGLAVSVNALQSWDTQEDAVVLSSQEARSLLGEACTNGQLGFLPCTNSMCDGKPQLLCDGVCVTCTSTSSHSGCTEMCIFDTKCEDLTPVTGGCGYFVYYGYCEWDPATSKCVCDGTPSQDGCARFRATPC